VLTRWPLAGSFFNVGADCQPRDACEVIFPASVSLCGPLCYPLSRRATDAWTHGLLSFLSLGLVTGKDSDLLTSLDRITISCLALWKSCEEDWFLWPTIIFLWPQLRNQSILWKKTSFSYTNLWFIIFHSRFVNSRIPWLLEMKS
jgi:hypothetical protein